MKFDFLLNKRNILLIWIAVAVAMAMKQYFTGDNPHAHINNFIIFRTSFWHLIHQEHLYAYHPDEYVDLFLYGPPFAVMIAPLALLPTLAGVILWNVANAVALLFAIYELPSFDEKTKAIMSWLCLNSCITSLINVQYHGIVTALIILAYTFIKKEKDFWAAFCIVLGTMTKLYGVVGLAFFFFSKNKLKLIASGLFWIALLFVLPMAFSSPTYILQTYQEWFEVLVKKNDINEVLTNPYQDLSVMGMVRRLAQDASISNLWYILPAVLVFALSYIRINLFFNTRYQLLLLCSTLMLVVLASTGTEASTLLIGFVGAVIWYMQSAKTTTDKALFIFALLVTSFGPTDLMPKYIRNEFLRKYALMVLPMLLVWIKVHWEMLASKKEEF
ncbi:glycosyltransferase family 87 protein [Flectobacillus roseus]|uniref:Glycosyltransferase family 87 protein n=1 Tax=Flectobacillus roseus TaxID=502259 RepID=A0ABT6YB73_9BACT|nr:glycosyltransferase family 87 protein [Flectobacillus roseus]MDI9860712.1 glycosyltransferase family 87 protein [Flectobacillus roseus]MDI9869195.1 glycosyltransferase family 87 protein [Flectobacillus roseus]